MRLLDMTVNLVNEQGDVECMPLDEALTRLESRACEILDEETVLADIAQWEASTISSGIQGIV